MALCKDEFVVQPKQKPPPKENPLLSLLSYCVLLLFPLAVAVALHTGVVAQHNAQDKIFFVCQFGQGTAGQHDAHRIDALWTAEEEIDPILTPRDGLREEIDTILNQPFTSPFGKSRAYGAQKQVPYAFLVLVKAIAQ